MHLRPSILLNLVFLSLLLFFPSCSKKKEKRIVELPRVEAEPFLYHQVRYPGETLFFIAKWYTGEGRNYKLIESANPDLIRDKIFLDQIIRIPKALVQRSEKFEKKELQAFLDKYKKALPTLAPVADPEVEGNEDLKPGIEPASQAPAESALPLLASPSAIPSPAPAEVQVEEPHIVRESSAEQMELRRKTRYELLQELIEGQ